MTNAIIHAGAYSESALPEFAPVFQNISDLPGISFTRTPEMLQWSFRGTLAALISFEVRRTVELETFIPLSNPAGVGQSRQR